MRSEIQNAGTIVVKVGTSTLTYENGKLNLKRMEQIARILTDVKNSGKKVVLVTSGAIGVGMSKMGLKEKPEEIKSMACGAGSKRGTGGMITKLTAAEIATDEGIQVVIANGKDPHIIYRILEGKEIGTIFKGKKA